MNATEIHELTNDDLAKALDDTRREQLNLRIQAQIGQLENSLRLRFVRRDIARLLTEQNSRRHKSS